MYELKNLILYRGFWQHPSLMRMVERVAGIEPVSYPWEGHILPLNYTRLIVASIRNVGK